MHAIAGFRLASESFQLLLERLDLQRDVLPILHHYPHLRIRVQSGAEQARHLQEFGVCRVVGNRAAGREDKFSPRLAARPNPLALDVKRLQGAKISLVDAAYQHSRILLPRFAERDSRTVR